MNPESFLFGDTSDLNFLSRMPGAVCLPIFICRTSFITHRTHPTHSCTPQPNPPRTQPLPQAQPLLLHSRKGRFATWCAADYFFLPSPPLRCRSRRPT